MKAGIRTALVMSLTLFGAASVEAAVTTDTDSEETVRVVNNYGEMVRVYAEDADGRLHKLGRVARGTLEEFEVPAEIADEAFRIKIYPSQPVWALSLDDFGVKTNPLNLRGDADVTVWVEPELTNTVVEMSRG